MPPTSSAMNNPDLETILSGFNEKIRLIEDLMPLARSCEATLNHQDSAVSRFDKWASDGSNGHSEKPELVDLEDMTLKVLAMRQMMAETKEKLLSAGNDLDQQEARINQRIGGIKAHLKYLKENMPEFLHDKPKAVAAANNKGQANGARNGPQNLAKSVVKTNPATTRPGAVPARNTIKKAGVKPTVSALSVKKRLVFATAPKIDFLTTEEFESIPGYVLQLNPPVYHRLSTTVTRGNG